MSVARLHAVQFASVCVCVCVCVCVRLWCVCVCDYGVCMALNSEPVPCGVSLLDASLTLNFVFVREDPHMDQPIKPP